MSEARLESWFRRTPPTAAVLELRYDGVAGLQPVARWSRDELERNAAQMVIDAARDHADDVDGRRHRFEVVWLDGDGQVLKTKVVRVETIDDSDKPDPAFVEPKEERNATGLVSQLMRHAETDRRMHNIAEANLLKFYRDALSDARSEIAELRAENKDLRKRWKAAEAKAEGETDAESDARAAAYEKMGDAVAQYLIPLVAQSIGSRGPEH